MLPLVYEGSNQCPGKNVPPPLPTFLRENSLGNYDICGEIIGFLSPLRRLAGVFSSITPSRTSTCLIPHAVQQVESFTLPMLKGFLKSRGLAVGGKKGDLVHRVKHALQEDFKG